MQVSGAAAPQNRGKRPRLGKTTPPPGSRFLGSGTSFCPSSTCTRTRGRHGTSAGHDRAPGSTSWPTRTYMAISCSDNTRGDPGTGTRQTAEQGPPQRLRPEIKKRRTIADLLETGEKWDAPKANLLQKWD